MHESAAGRALHGAWLAEFSCEPPFRLVDELARSGWTAATVPALAGMVDRALAARTGLAAVAGRRPSAAVLLARTAATLALMAPSDVPEILDWVRALAGEPVWRDVDRPGGLVYAGRGQARPLEQWHAGLPHGPGLLAFAAGLGPAEAADRHRAGTLDGADLRVLAALRGAAQL